MFNPEEVLKIVHPGYEIKSYELFPAPKSSHDVAFIRYNFNGDVRNLVVKAVPEKRYPTKNYDVQAEYTLLKALASQELAYGVPKPIINSGVMPSSFSFFVMEMLTGNTYGDLIHQDGFNRHARGLMQVLASIHSTPLQSVLFVERPVNTGHYIAGLIEKLRFHVLEKGSAKETQRFASTFSFLMTQSPEVEQIVLLNGDFGADQVFVCHEKDYVIDWDPAFIGDRSWDLWWMSKGGFAKGISRTPEGFEEYIGLYEDESKTKLLNSAFFKFASQAYSYYLGKYIQTNDPTHTAAKRIAAAQPILMEYIDRQLKDKAL